MYKISIQKIENVPGVMKEWKQVADTGNKQDNGPMYAYVDRECDIERRTEVLEQTVGELNVGAVVAVINGLQMPASCPSAAHSGAECGHAQP